LTITIIDYGSGNLRSVYESVHHVTDRPVSVVTDASSLRNADHIILPGVGSFKACMEGLAAIEGMIDVLSDAVLAKKKPFLGICVGMQLLADRGLEHGETAGLGWIEGEVSAIEIADSHYKIPHMGWNDLVFKQSHPLFTGIEEGTDMYFVHSYQFRVKNAVDILATTDYGGEIVAAIAKDNIVATQFHPEKSQQKGLQLLRNFVEGKIG